MNLIPSTRIRALLMMATLMAAPAALAADATRPLPPIAAACDVIDWTSAQLGRCAVGMRVHS